MQSKSEKICREFYAAKMAMDKAVLKDGFATATDANVWVAQNEMNLA